jgi:hypothetical protein
MSCNEVGNISLPNGDELSYDALPVTSFRLQFPKTPHMLMFLQEFSMPGIDVREVIRPTQFVDINEVGEKIIYQPFTCTFLVDKKLKNFKEIHDWMKRMTASGTIIGETDNVVLIVNNKEMIRFNDAWPTNLSGLRFITNASDVQYLTCTATWNFDYFEFV